MNKQKLEWYDLETGKVTKKTMEEVQKDCSKSAAFWRGFFQLRQILYSEDCEPEKQIMIMRLVLNLLPEKKLQRAGYFLNRLLKKNDITYYELAKRLLIYRDVWGADKDSYNMDETDMSSRLQKMVNSKTCSTDNPLINYICDYFSVSREVLLYGRGKKYTADDDTLKAALEEHWDYSDDFLKAVCSKKQYKPSPKEKETLRKCIRDSDLICVKMVADLLHKDEKDFLHEEEEDFIDEFDFDMFTWYFVDLNETEMEAVVNLAKDFQKVRVTLL